MSTQVKRRRGTATQHATFTGAAGEITVDTTNNAVVVHDGVTPGGYRQDVVTAAKITDANSTGRSILTGDLKGRVSFASRAAAVTWFGAGNTLPTGTSFSAGSYEYRYTGSGTAISDLANIVAVPPYSVAHWGFVGDGTAADTAKANAAIAWLGANGGGDMHFPWGSYTVANTASVGDHWDDQQCIYVGVSKVRLIGYGCKLTLGANQNGHVIKLGKRATTTVSVNDVAVLGFELDGNRSNNAGPQEEQDHWSGIEVCSGSTRITLQDMYIHDTIYYGYAFQRQGFRNCSVINCVGENLGADGIDCKSDLETERGNRLVNFRVKDWGLLQASLLTPQAGIDLRSGWVCSGADVEATTTIGDRVGIRLQDYTADPTVVSPAHVTNFTVTGPGKTVSGFIGVRCVTRSAVIESGRVYGCADGVSVSNPDGRLANIQALQCGTGFRFWQDSAGGVEADTMTCTGLSVRTSNAGIVVDSVDELTFLGCDVRSTSGIGLDIRSGCTNIRYLGGSLIGNATADVSDSGTGTVIQDVSGYRTRSVKTGTFAIDSTGTKTITIAHTLGVTPSINDVSLTMQRTSNVGDWSWGFMWVDAVDATSITAKVRVLTASATAGATETVVATTVTKATM